MSNNYKVGIAVTADTSGVKELAAGFRGLEASVKAATPALTQTSIETGKVEAESKKAADAFRSAETALQRESILLKEGADATYRFDRRLEGLTDAQIKHLEAMRKSNAELRETANASGLAANGITGLGSVIGTIIATATTAAAGVAMLTGSLLRQQQELSASATAVGVTTQSLQVWRSEAQKVGIQADKLTDIFKDFNDKRGDLFRNDAGELKDGFKALNLDIKEFVKLAPDEALLRLGKAMRESGLTLSEKTFLLEAIDDASRLIPLLEATSSKLHDIKNTASQSATVLMDSQIESLKKVNADLSELSNAWEGVKTQIGMIGAEIARNLTDEINAATGALNTFALGLRDISDSMRSVTDSPDDLLTAIAEGQTDEAITQIRAYTAEFKTASQSRRAEIRQELLDFYEALKQRQSQHAAAITSASQFQGGMLGGMADSLVNADASKLAELARVSAAVMEAFSATGSILNPAYWDELEAAQKPFWDDLKRSPAAATAGTDKVSKSVASWLPATVRYKQEISAAVAEFGNLDEAIIKAVMAQESLIAAKKRGVSPESIQSSAGATGLMQIMPGTFSEVTDKLGMTGASIYNAADNIRAGAAYLSQMLEKTGGDMEKALAAYNAGLGNVQKSNGIPPFKETQGYVQNIMTMYRQLTGVAKKEEDQRTRDVEIAAKQRAEIAKLNLDTEAQAKLAAVDKEAALAGAQEAKTAADYSKRLEQEKGFEEQRYQIKRAALESQQALASKQGDTVSTAKLNAQIEQLAAAHSLRLIEIEQQASVKLETIRKRDKEQTREAEALKAKHQETIALAAVDAAEQAARERQQIGMIDMEKLLQYEQQFENRRYQIKQQALLRLQQLGAQNPDSNPVQRMQLQQQLEQLELQHQQRLAQIRQQAYMQSRQRMTQFIQQSTQGIQQQLAGILSFTTSLSDGIRGMFQAVLSAAANMLAEMAARWLTNTLLTMVYGKTQALTQVGANAAAAGSGAYAATAAIPVVGPALAPAAGAAAYAGAMSFAAAIPAAAKGFDIPAGVNPLTQLHEKEMVLPAHLADNVRNMTGRGGDSINISISAMDSRDVRRLFQNEGGALTSALRNEVRNFRGIR